jgi:hypothetical protein
MIVRKQGDWLSARVGDEVLMMSAERGAYIGLSAVGVRVWDLLDTTPSSDDIYAVLEREYSVDGQTCRAEVDAFLVDLAHHRAVAIDPSPGI